VLTPNDLDASGSGLADVSCVSATHCVAVGFSANADVADTWNGTKWLRSVLPGSGGGEPSSVSCTSTTYCVAVTSGPTPTSLVLDGGTWTAHAVPGVSALDSSLFSVSCASEVSCSAVGWNSTTGNSLADMSVLAEGWNGSTWRVETTAHVVGSVFYGVACPLISDCLAVGSKGAGTPAGLVEQRAA
jgi:hypothetical protein